ncbi:MAG: DUF3313 domain-containing protein [Methylococcaceae bacterium]|jgi:hypothetical protein
MRPAIFVVVILLLISGCARTYQARHVEPSGFLDDYSMLTKGKDGDALLSYWKKEVNWAEYKKIILAPVVIRKNADSELNQMTHAQNHHLKEFVELLTRDALKNNFKLVNKPGLDTLRLEIAITDAQSSTMILDQFSTVYPSARTLSFIQKLATGTESYVGKASIERKISNSMTGEVLMASADCRAGGKTLAGTFNEWDDVEQAYIYWAAQLRYQLCVKKGNQNCQLPDSE